MRQPTQQHRLPSRPGERAIRAAIAILQLGLAAHALPPQNEAPAPFVVWMRRVVPLRSSGVEETYSSLRRLPRLLHIDIHLRAMLENPAEQSVAVDFELEQVPHFRNKRHELLALACHPRMSV